MKIAVILIAIYLFIILVAPVIILNVLCNRHFPYKKLYRAEDFGLDEPEDFFLTTDDGLKINVKLASPADVKAVMIIVSGIDGPTVTSFYGYAKRYNDMGYACFMPELRAHGRSEGNMICLAYKETADVEAVVKCARERFPGKPIDLMGLSMGAATVLRVIGDDPLIRSVVSFSGYSSIEDVIFGYVRKFLTPLLAFPLRPVATFVCSRKFGVDAKTATPINGMSRLNGRPALLVHSTKDCVVPFLCFKNLKAEAEKHSDKVKTFNIKGNHHLITKDIFHPEADTELWKTLTEFLKRL